MYSHFLHATMTETTIEMTSKWSFQKSADGTLFCCTQVSSLVNIWMWCIFKKHTS